MPCETGGLALGGECKTTGTMGEDTTGRTLTEELCFMLFFGLNRGKRLFLMTGGLASGTCTCNKEEGDWWHRETRCTGQTQGMTLYLCTCARYANALSSLKAAEEIQTDVEGQVHETRCWRNMCKLPFGIFSFSSLLHGRNPASPFLWMALRGSTQQCRDRSWKQHTPLWASSLHVRTTVRSELNEIQSNSKRKKLCCDAEGNYQGSNPGWRLEWLVTPSEESPELRLWPLLSWKELSGRGEGTVGQNTRQRLRATRNELKGFNSSSLSPWSCASSCVCFVRKCN